MTSNQMTSTPGTSDQVPPPGLYTLDEGQYVPSEFTRGPWRADAQHGGPPSALLASLCEPHVEDGEFLAQLHIELLRPVRLRPLRPVVERTRVSGRVGRIIAELTDDGETVARVTATVLRESELTTPDFVAHTTPATEPPTADATVDPPRWASGDVTTYHRNAVEHRFTEGSFRTPGPAVDWMRLRLPLIAGEPTSGLQRIAAAADFGSGISAVYGATSPVGLINANLTINLIRSHKGEWVSLDATTHVGAGTGLGITMLGDTSGLVGVATQSLLGYSTGL